MGMYVHVVFGVMLTDDLGYSHSVSKQTQAFLEQLGDSHSNPNIVSFKTVDEPVHCVGVYIKGTDYGAMTSIPLANLSHNASHWMNAFQQCLHNLPLEIQNDVAKLKLPAFHIIAGVN